MTTALPRPARPWLALAVLLTAACVGACGQTVRVGPSRVLQLTMSEYRLRPQRISVAAGTLSIYVHNYGRLSHDLAISQGTHILASTQPIRPGQTGELVADLPRGQYLMSSTVLSDQALGLYGTLVVTR
jgi:hypothetical protein